MGNILLSFIALFGSTLLLTTAIGLLGTLLSLRMTLENYSSQIIGLVMANYYLGLVIGAVFCRRVIQRVGHIRAFSVFGALNLIAVLLHGLMMEPWFWWLLRGLSGISMMGLYMVLESWLCECSTPATRGRVFSIYMSCSFLGLAGGQWLINAAPVQQDTLFFIVALFLVSSLLPVALTRAISPIFVVATPFGLRQLAGKAPFGMLGCFCSGLATGSFLALGPSFAMQLGIQRQGIAWFMGLTIFSGLLSQWPVGVFSDRHDRRLLLVMIAIALAFACGAVLLVVGSGLSQSWLLLASALFGGLANALYPVAVAHTHDHIEKENVVSVSVLLLLFYGLGATVGPLSASQLMAYAGPGGLYLLIGCCSGLLALAGLLHRRPKAIVHRTPYVAMPRTSPVIQQLDPRIQESVPEQNGTSEQAPDYRDRHAERSNSHIHE